MLQGTLDLLILRTLALGPAHGQSIAQPFEQTSPRRFSGRARFALSGAPSARGAADGRAVWGTSENNRREHGTTTD